MFRTTHFSVTCLFLLYISSFTSGDENCFNCGIKPAQQSPFKDLSVYLVTWNVWEHGPPANLESLFDFDRMGTKDIYVFAVQELDYKTLVLTEHFSVKLEKIFGNRDFVLLKKKRFYITSLFVYVRKSELDNYVDVQSDFVVIDTFMQKGAASIRFNYLGVSIVMTGAHLAAHDGDEHYKTRIDNYQNIIKKTRFDDFHGKILEHDYAFFIGDLNFRTNELSRDEIMDIVRSQDWNKLYQYDQLKKARETRQAFVEFKEEPIAFAPTWKWFPNTYNYNLKRRPAWTDRILYRDGFAQPVATYARDLVSVKVSDYTSLTELVQSDHRPVRAVAVIPAAAFQLRANKVRNLNW